MVFTNLSPAQQERAICSISAAVKYAIPANIVLAVAEQEGGRPGLWVGNTNGTYDVGAMQFNTAYVRGLAQYGITIRDVAASGCYSYNLAAWRLREHLLHERGDLWTRAAVYHSRTPAINAVYRRQIMVRAERWARWLEARYVTYDVTPGRNPVTRAATVGALTSAIAPLVEKKVLPVVPEMPRRPLPLYTPRSIVIASNGEQP